MPNLHGILTALITPFKHGELDLPALRGLVARQLKAGVHGLVPLGSTGEAATLDFDERARVISTVIESVDGRIPVVVNCGTNDTRSSIANTRQAKELGADAAMIVVPYYNKPTPQGFAAHLDAIEAAVTIPLVLYNIPSRTGLNLSAEHAIALAKRPAIIGIKEGSGNIFQVQDILAETRGDWALLSGEDALTFTILALGGHGVICTASNTAPERFVALYDAFLAGDYEKARTLQAALLPLIRAHFTSTNPIPAKAAAHLLGLTENELRLPLTPLDAASYASLKALLEREGLLGGRA